MATMMTVAASLAVAALIAFAAHGWGSLVCRASRLRDSTPPMTAAIGVAAWVALGGVLNLTRLARPLVLDAIVVAGWAMAAWRLRHVVRQSGAVRSPMASRVMAAIPWAAVVVMAAFVAVTLVPPGAYNFHDDFLTYFVHPVRMLETGTIYGSPVSEIGRLALGGQAFLHGFVLAHFPLRYVNAVDALFALGLALAMLASWANRRGPAPVGALLSIALFVAINPQVVNVSPVYSASSMVVLAFLLSASTRGEGIRPLIPEALVAAALVALKPTFLPFAGMNLLFVALADGWERRSVRAFAGGLAARLGLAAAFVAPWVAVHAPHYLAALGAPARQGGPRFGAINPFDTTPLFYGDDVLHFTLAVLVSVVVGVAFAVASRRAEPDGSAARRRVAATCLAAGATYGVFLLVPAIYGASPERIVRFFCPIAVAAAPAALVLAWTELPRALPIVTSAARPALVGVALVVVTSFTSGLWARAAQASEHGSILAFRTTATSPAYMEYTRAALSDEVRDRVAAMQALVPPGEPLVAWIAAPYDLDFARNPVFDVDLAGLANPWAILPSVRFLLWSYRGPAIRSSAACGAMEGTRADEIAGARCVELRRWLASLADSGDAEVLADDGETVLLRRRTLPPS